MYKVNDYLSLMSKTNFFFILKFKKKAGMTGSVRNKRKSFIDKWHKRRCIIRAYSIMAICNSNQQRNRTFLQILVLSKCSCLDFHVWTWILKITLQCYLALDIKHFLTNSDLNESAEQQKWTISMNLPPK